MESLILIPCYFLLFREVTRLLHFADPTRPQFLRLVTGAFLSGFEKYQQWGLEMYSEVTGAHDHLGHLCHILPSLHPFHFAFFFFSGRPFGAVVTMYELSESNSRNIFFFPNKLVCNDCHGGNREFCLWTLQLFFEEGN